MIFAAVLVWWLCDNKLAVHKVCGRSCCDHDMMHLICCLFFLEAWFDFELVAAHLPGRQNMLADDLSRNHRSAFLSNALSADLAPTILPPELPGLRGWTSLRWTRLFYATVTAVQPTPPRGHNGQVSTASSYSAMHSRFPPHFLYPRRCYAILLRHWCSRALRELQFGRTWWPSSMSRLVLISTLPPPGSERGLEGTRQLDPRYGAPPITPLLLRQIRPLSLLDESGSGTPTN